MDGRVAAVAALTVAVALATVPTGGLAQSNGAAVAPGERFSGVVGVQETEIQSEVESRAFRVRFERAGSDAARAAVIADRIDRARERLRALERERERLRAARANGTMSEGQYRARVARMAAEANALREQVNRTADASREVPDAALRERGVDPAELERLRTVAGELTGPEIAAIARNLTGADRGPPAGVGAGDARRAAERGPPSDGGNESGGAATAAGGAADGGGGDGRSGSERDGIDRGGGPGENGGTPAGSDESGGDADGAGDGSHRGAAQGDGDSGDGGAADSSDDAQGDGTADNSDDAGGGASERGDGAGS